MDSPSSFPHPINLNDSEFPPPRVDLSTLDRTPSDLHYARRTLELRLIPSFWTHTVPLTDKEKAAEAEEQGKQEDPPLIKVARPSYDYDDIAILLVKAHQLGKTGRPLTILDWE